MAKFLPAFKRGQAAPIMNVTPNEACVVVDHRPTVPDVLPLVRRLYDGDDACSRDSGCVGGHLHIVLDDKNVKDGHVAFCLDEAKEDGCVTCTVLAELLMRMSKTQRAKIARIR